MLKHKSSLSGLWYVLTSYAACARTPLLLAGHATGSVRTQKRRPLSHRLWRGAGELGFPCFSGRLLSTTKLLLEFLHKMMGNDDLLATMSTIVLVCLLVLRRRRARQKKKWLVWVRPCWRYRDLEGQACTLLRRLRANDGVFFRE